MPVILVIEGDETTRNILVEALHGADFAVVAPATGAQGLATVESRLVSLVISAAGLRGLSGTEVLRKPREREARHRLPPTPSFCWRAPLIYWPRPASAAWQHLCSLASWSYREQDAELVAVGSKIPVAACGPATAAQVGCPCTA